MSVMLSNGFVVQAAVGSGQPQVDTVRTMAECAARYVGTKHDSVVNLAFEGIQRGVHELNLYGPFLFGTTTQADVNLTANVTEYDLPTDFFAMRAVQLVDSDGNVASTLRFIPWDQINAQDFYQDSDGIPRYWTVKNSFIDGKVIVGPTPGTAEATDYDLRLVTVKGVPQITSLDDVIAAPARLSHLLCTFAEEYVARRRAQDNPELARAAASNFRRLLRAFKGSEQDQAGGVYQIRVGTQAGFTEGSF